jgi:hypothetical protein
MQLEITNEAEIYRSYKLSLNKVQTLDKYNDREPLKIVAPSSGLQLYDIEFIQ